MTVSDIAAHIVEQARGAYTQNQIEAWLNDNYPAERTTLNCNLLVALSLLLDENPQDLFKLEPDFASAYGLHRPGYNPDDEAKLLLTFWRLDLIRVFEPSSSSTSCVRMLTERDKKAFDAAWQHGLSIGDIAGLLNIPTNTRLYLQLRDYALSQGCDLRARGIAVGATKRRKINNNNSKVQRNAVHL
ncbi:hypothetical protein [Pseudanabaena sp. FACHB-2040]|uniref:hypothetical protein n=1 Tax=Pseudanabaena sp. FACHB-2040 TaxID=2692859 RepID=UPI00168792E2|nr:hypothetical protein [Pseudanabaena sp. FACHB-2040]MBD2256675.1 hypothetical protein [Pseudanabaena sp. FACHB-2040]